VVTAAAKTDLKTGALCVGLSPFFGLSRPGSNRAAALSPAERFDLCANSFTKKRRRAKFCVHHPGLVSVESVRLKGILMGEASHSLVDQTNDAFSRTKRTKLRPQLPCWCREHRSGRARSKDRSRPQLCAKPRLCRLTARRASASSLPTGGAFPLSLGRLPRPVMPHALAAGGMPAHLAGVRRRGSDRTVDRARPDHGPAQLPPRPSGATALFEHRPSLAGCALRTCLRRRATSPGPGRLLCDLSWAAHSPGRLWIPARRFPGSAVRCSSQMTPFISTRTGQKASTGCQRCIIAAACCVRVKHL
jgi:hypothetical protein